MDKLKKSGENVTSFIIDSLKGKNTVDYGKLPIMPEMRNLNPTTKHIESTSLQIVSALENDSQNGLLQNVMKFLALLLVLFIIYKIIESQPDIMAKIQSIFGKVEKEIKSIRISNPMFDVSNNLNSNQILDFLLGTKKSNEEWCFVGESNGKRYCALSEGNRCMSGNIFPSKNLCINPKLKT